MFSCVTCGKVYARKNVLIRHAKTHGGPVNSCGICRKVLSRMDKLIAHIQNCHKIAKNSPEFHNAVRIGGTMGRASVIRWAPPTTTSHVRSAVPTAISVTSTPPQVSPSARPPVISSRPVAAETPPTATAAPSRPTSPPPPVQHCAPYTENTRKNIKRKKARMQSVNTPGFVEIESSLKRTTVWYFRKNVDNIVSYRAFLHSLEPELIDKLRECVRIQPIKYNLKLEATYVVPNQDESAQNRAFKTCARELFAYSDVAGLIDRDLTALLAEEDAYAGKGSGFTLSCIDGLLLGVYEFTPMGGSSYLPLPESILHRKAVVNPQNVDSQCFKWAILVKHVAVEHRERVGANYLNEECRYDFSALSVPTPVSEIKLFERANPGTSVNVYGVKNCKKNKKNKSSTQSAAYPLRVVDDEQPNHFDLLLIAGSEKNNHYTYISNFSRLVSLQKNNREHRLFFCKKCFTSFDDRPLRYKLHGEEALAQHRLVCGTHKPILPVMPAEGTTLEFDALRKTQRLPFVLYADFEALLPKTTQHYGVNTSALHSHHPMSYGFLVVAADGVPAELLEQFGIARTPTVYRGSESADDVAKRFVLAVTDVADRICKLLKTTNVPIVMSVEDVRAHGVKTACDLCAKTFTTSNRKVAHHDHLSGRFLKTLCNACNLALRTPKFVPCFLHNLSNYDAHFIVTELGYDTNTISVIPNSEEKYISFSKYINNEFAVRFIDTCRFMASSLAVLARNLTTSDFCKFREVAKVFTPTEMPLVTRKGVFPYEYTDSYAKLRETALPARKEFYSALAETHVSDTDYEHAALVWNHFGCRTLGDYSDLYLEIDVLLSADVFENFRDICMLTYQLDPAYYYTAPGFSFDCMLKFTSVKLELLTDYEQILFFELGIRGGLVQASGRHAKANNPKTPGYKADEPNTWLVYQDCNNLYGWAMSGYMPYGGFSWYAGNPDVALAQLEWMTDTDDVGRVYEVDISYPRHLHDEHNDIPFLPHASIPSGSTVRKLMATFERKVHYVVHYSNLKQAIANGLIVDKVHRVLEFRQSPWLAPYIALNTEMRKRATNEFEEKFFKDQNNSVFGKTMENVRNRFEMELVSCPQRMRKLINRPTFKQCTTYSENLAAVSMHNKMINFCKPIYIGFAVLERSKTLMYDYHYNVMKRHYGDKIALLYTDTDSLLYCVSTDDFYSDLADNPNLRSRTDTSNLPPDHACYTSTRKRIPGLFKDETGGRTMYEFVALRAKSYAYDIENATTIRAKGIRGHVIRNHLTFEDHKRCLFAVDDDDDDESDERDDEFNARTSKLIASSCAQQVIARMHTAATTAASATTSSTSSPPPPPPPPMTRRSYEPYTPYRENVSIRSFKHKIKTIKTMKLALNRSDDKRHVLPDRVHTLAHGHYKIV
ncbi:uncharacterized protein LOC132927701 [Rhopalosiphum padi]|uniref:uncharacterized protein LOC132927701 n=1 Tax=Rhopalosiphum padi TaxID=40932 RepID=UPI00298DB10A|nr:uncharacterized protein LOC132927701 [Rhopalosiphum padi]